MVCSWQQCTVALKLFKMIFWCRQKRILWGVMLPASNVVLRIGHPCDMSGTFKLGQALLILLCMSVFSGKKKKFPKELKELFQAFEGFPFEEMETDRREEQEDTFCSETLKKPSNNRLLICISFFFSKRWAVNLHVSRHVVSSGALWGDCKSKDLQDLQYVWPIVRREEWKNTVFFSFSNKKTAPFSP